MDRELKFRYRLKNKATGNIVTHIFSLEGIEQGIDRHYEILSRDRYTGLHDSKGVEIYEGDRVRRIQNKGVRTIHTIVFTDYRFAYTTEYHGSIALNKVVSQHQSLEVIGNIYEQGTEASS